MRARNPVRCFRILQLLACLALVLAPAQLPLPAAAEGAANAEWDQQRVTELAVQLAVATRDLRSQVRTGFPAERGLPQARIHRLLDHLRVLQNETRFLSAELEAGQGFDETLPVAQRIDRLVDRAVVDARRLDMPEPVQQRLDKADDLLEQLRSFYRNYESPDEAKG